MASNFDIVVNKSDYCFNLNLQGDFDSTSAYELIYALKKLPGNDLEIAICTNGLKEIHPFGLEVFHNYINSLNGQSTRIVFTGRNAPQLSLRKSQSSVLAVLYG